MLARVDAELRKVIDEVVTDEELVRAKARLELGLVQSLETASGKAEQIGFNDTVLGDPAAAFRRLEAYRRVTAGEMRTAARRYLTARRAHHHPCAAGGGREAQRLRRLEHVGRRGWPGSRMTTASPMKPEKTSAPKKKAAATHGATSTRYDLPGGAVGYVESSTALPLVSLSFSLRSGSLADPEGKDGLSRITARMMRRGCKA